MTTSLPTPSSGYLLEESLKDLHQKTLEWESSLEFWKRELAFFKKLMDDYGRDLHMRNQIEEREHFKQLLSYYTDGLMNSLTIRIRQHEASLKQLLNAKDKQDETSYRLDHKTLEFQISTFQKEFQSYKHELYSLIEKVLVKKNHR